MNATQAHNFVALRLSPTTEPTISDVEIRQLLDEMAVTVDADDVEPFDDGWVPTFSRLGAYAVLAEGWGLKAGRAAHRFDFTAPSSGGAFKVSQIIDHCEAQAKMYAGLANRSVRNAD